MLDHNTHKKLSRENMDQNVKVEIINKGWQQHIPAWAAVFISLLALFMTIWGAVEQRKFYKQSFFPDLTFQLYSAISDEQKAGILIETSGPGPVRVVEFELFFDGKTVQSWEDITSALYNNNLKFWADEKPRWAAIDGTLLIPAGKEIWLYRIVEKLSRSRQKYLEESFERIDIRLVYCSIYDDCWQRCLNDICEYKKMPGL